MGLARQARGVDGARRSDGTVIVPTVTFTGEEIGLVAGCIAATLPDVDGPDREVLDLLLDRALAVMPRPLSPGLVDRIDRLRAE